MSKIAEQIQQELNDYLSGKSNKDLKKTDNQIIGYVKVAKTLEGRIPWTQGLKRPEHAEKMKRQMTGINNPMHGIEPWNKGLDKTDLRVLAYNTDTAYKGQPGNQHGKGNIGKKQDEEWKRKRLDKIKGSHAIAICPHCKKEGGERSMKRWHFENCKLKK